MNNIRQTILAAGLMCGVIGGFASEAQTVYLPEMPEQPQVMTWDNGTKLSLIGVTRGTVHIGPYGNRLYTASDTPVVWIQTDRGTNVWGDYSLLVSDQAGTGCVITEVKQRSNNGKGSQIYAFVLDAFPRWDTETVLRAAVLHGALANGQFIITNPAAGPAPDWVPKLLPDTESDGDLSVTLTQLVAGTPAPSGAAYYPGRIRAATNDLANQCVRLHFDIQQNGEPTTNWQAWPVRTSDAVGNQVRGLIYGYPASGVFYKPLNGPDDGYFYQSGLWPEEPAWKVRMELIRRSGFGDDEIVTFTNLPVKPGSQQDWDDQWGAWDVGKTNFPFPVTPGTVNGVHLQLLPPLLVPDKNSPGEKKYVSVIIGADPDFNPKGMNLTVLQATDDQGRELWSPFGVSWAGHYSIDLPNVREIKSLNLKLALHRSRFVEFTVKPEKQ
ncbi:MAG TPA: hypothetical protein VH251_04135 [Verrucomicrobiae bacterium]|nr:hypothetical protein [Verrucomicrobiae bacterium]